MDSSCGLSNSVGGFSPGSPRLWEVIGGGGARGEESRPTIRSFHARRIQVDDAALPETDAPLEIELPEVHASAGDADRPSRGACFVARRPRGFARVRRAWGVSEREMSDHLGFRQVCAAPLAPNFTPPSPPDSRLYIAPSSRVNDRLSRTLPPPSHVLLPSWLRTICHHQLVALLMWQKPFIWADDYLEGIAVSARASAAGVFQGLAPQTPT